MSKKYGSTSNTTVSGGGVGLLTVLWVVFLILKLTGVITWSWGLVLLPLWIQIVIIALILIIVLMIALSERM